MMQISAFHDGDLHDGLHGDLHDDDCDDVRDVHHDVRRDVQEKILDCWTNCSARTLDYCSERILDCGGGDCDDVICVRIFIGKLLPSI